MSTDELPPTKVTLALADTAVSSATVFNDRAEVTRKLTFNAESDGVYELCVEGLTSKCDPDSVRVKSAAGGAPVTILEVAFEVHSKPIDDADSTGAEEVLRAKERALSDDVARVQAEQKRNEEARALLTGYVKGMLSPLPGKDGAAPPPAGDDLSKVEAMLAFHGARVAEHDTRAHALGDEERKLGAQLEAVRTELRQFSRKPPKRTKESRDVTVLLQVHAPKAPPLGSRPLAQEVELSLTYMVSGASWTPSYDVRVDSAAGTLAFTYFGLVHNGSGEDWLSCALVLSTARPAKGGMPPAPPRRQVRWKVEQPKMRARRRMYDDAPRGAAIPMQACMMERQLSCDACEAMAFSSMMDEEEDLMLSAAPSVATSTVDQSGGGAATFRIERRVAIASDGKPHKVTVALLDFAPQLLYFATPSLEQDCYLQVKARNTSSFPILASDKVSVFFDGSFVTSTELKDVAPSEEFTTFLGADAAIKLEHKTLAREHKAATGWGSKVQTTVHPFLSVVTNTKALPVTLTLVEVLPKSTEDKIKVELLQPPPKELVEASATRDTDTAAKGKGEGKGELVVMQNKVTNNVVWTLTLAPGAKKELPFSYSVTWPSDREVETQDERQ